MEAERHAPRSRRRISSAIGSQLQGFISPTFYFETTQRADKSKAVHMKHITSRHLALLGMRVNTQPVRELGLRSTPEETPYASEAMAITHAYNGHTCN